MSREETVAYMIRNNMLSAFQVKEILVADQYTKEQIEQIKKQASSLKDASDGRITHRNFVVTRTNMRAARSQVHILPANTPVEVDTSIGPIFMEGRDILAHCDDMDYRRMTETAIGEYRSPAIKTMECANGHMKRLPANKSFFFGRCAHEGCNNFLRYGTAETLKRA